MKKMLIIFIACCLSLMWSVTGRADQKLFEEEILDLLKEKNIITPEKYQELSHKLKKEKQSVNEAILELLKEQKIVSQPKYDELKAKAEEEKKKATVQVVQIPEALKGVQFKGTWYLDYKAGKRNADDERYNEFSLTRGYLDFRKEFTPWFSGRITPDITRDSTGDYKLRIKYLYGNFKLPDFKIFTKNWIEVGMIHTPWFDFEENINIYRSQGTMFIERNEIMNSADLGVGFFGYFGGEMPEEYLKKVNKHWAGRYGSYGIGIYNGGGYHAGENNENKAFEARLTLRPFPDRIPGLQLTYFNTTAKGNRKEEPDWKTNIGFLSYEAAWGTLIAQYADAKGSQKGEYKVGSTTFLDERDKDGYSFFANLKAPWNPRYRAFVRYDFWDPDDDIKGDTQKRYIGGLSYAFYKECMLTGAYENLKDSAGKDAHFFQTVMQIMF